MKIPIPKDINSILSLRLARINQFIMHQENAAGLELCKGSEAERAPDLQRHLSTPKSLEIRL